MGAVNGKDFINRLNQLNNEIWFDGVRIQGKVSEHPIFKGLIQTKASLYDLQHDPTLKEQMMFLSPKKKEPVGISYLQPKTKEDLMKRRTMIEHWARHWGHDGKKPRLFKYSVNEFCLLCESFNRKR